MTEKKIVPGNDERDITELDKIMLGSEPPAMPFGPTANCPACAASGVGVCDEYPDCQRGQFIMEKIRKWYEN